MAKMNEVRKRVEDLLRENEALRNDDLALTFAYWNLHDNAEIENPPTVATSPASIIRARALIQSEGRCPPTDPVIREKREKRRQEVHAWIAEGAPDAE